MSSYREIPLNQHPLKTYHHDPSMVPASGVRSRPGSSDEKLDPSDQASHYPHGKGQHELKKKPAKVTSSSDEAHDVISFSTESQSCRDLWEENERDPKFIFAFMIGVNPRRDLGLGFDHFDVDHSPFVKRKRECKPTSKIMQKEIVRRAVNAKAPRRPRPAQWSGDKLLDWLKNKLPPQLTSDDCVFLRNECQALFTEILSRNREESMLQQPLPSGQGWTDERSYLRLYHSIFELKDHFIARIRNHSVTRVRHGEFWSMITVKFNNQIWFPKSEIIHILKEYQESFYLPFIFPENVPQQELQKVFESAKARLKIQLTGLHQREQIRPAQHKDGIAEKFLYPSNQHLMEQRINFPNHIRYLWEVANRHEILGSVVASIADSPDTDEEGEEGDSILPEAGDDASRTPSGMLPQIPSSNRPSRSPQQESPPAQRRARTPQTNGNNVDTQAFLESQKIGLKQWQMYNKLENELFELEVKKVQAPTQSAKSVYKKFADRKKASIALLKQQMSAVFAFSQKLSKRVRLNTTDSTNVG